MRHCPNCANLIADSAHFCPFCGQPQAAPESPPQPTWHRLEEDNPERTQPMHRQGPPPGWSQGPVYPTVPPPPTIPPPPASFPPAASPQRGWSANTNYRLLVIVLAVMFLCAATLAVVTLWTATTGGAGRLISQAGDRFKAPPGMPEATPTETSLPPTPTPWPTLTPEPVVELPETNSPPADQPGSQEGLQILSPACAAALDHMEEVSGRFTQSPSAVFDAGWRAETRQALDDMRSACGSLESASPVPGQVSEVQRMLSLTSDTYENANRLLKEGIEERRPGKVWEAGQQFTQAIKYLNETITALRAIGR